MLSLDDLRFFSVVAGARSLADVARQLDVTPPAISQRLAALERRLGVRLLDRQHGGVHLTDEGDAVAAKARLILEELDELDEEIASRRDRLSGNLRVTAPFGFGRRYIAPLIAAFQAEHPAVTIELRLSDSPPDASNRTDLAIHIGELKDGAGIVTKLAPNDRIVCAAPALLKIHGTPLSAADLSRFPCIALRENEEDSTLWRFSHAGETVSVRIRPSLASNDGEITRLWALAARGIIVRSEWNVADDLRSGALVRVLHDFQPPAANVVALLGPTRARLARTQKFLDYVRSALHPAPWRE